MSNRSDKRPKDRFFDKDNNKTEKTIYKANAKNVNRKPPSKKERVNFVMKELCEFLPSSCADFISTQLRCIQKTKKGVRWGEADKATALALFHASPKAYRLLQGIFLLPSVSTLGRCMRQASVFPGFNDKILQALKLRNSPFHGVCLSFWTSCCTFSQTTRQIRYCKFA